jgi:SOS response regulatory protein OraA/RecX
MELEQKLSKKGFSEQNIKIVLDNFEERGYINDSDCALSYIEELKRKRIGKFQAIRRLAGRGLDRDLAAKLASTFFLENDEIQHIRYLLDKRKFDLKDPRGLKKAIDFFLRRGFEQSTIRQVFKNYFPGGFEGED